MNHEIPHESRSEHEVVVVGGGPAGMMLAAELTLANVDVVVVERRETQDLESPRSRGLHARTIEVLDQRGIADRFLAVGTPMQVQAFAGMPLDISDFPTRHNYGLALVQSDFERIMAAWLAELGVEFMRSCEVTGFTAHHEHVEVTLADGATLHAEYLVGCDGSRSLVPQDRRHRVRRLGSERLLDHRRGRDAGEARVRHARRRRDRPSR